MSSHHTQKFFNLHHEQVVSSRKRKAASAYERQERHLAVGHAARLHYDCVRVLAFIFFAYMGIASALYTGYVLGA